YDFGATTLKVGSRGEAVKAVQTVVGATPVDGIFGAMTKAKVMAWQASNGLTADGLFGPASKAKANAVLGTTPTTPTTPSTPSTPSTTLKGDEADLTWSIDAEDDLDQDANDQHAFTIEIEADKKGGDAKIERLDLVFKTTGAATYRSISRVALEVDGDVVAESDTDSKSDWRKTNSTSDTVRFTNLDLVVKSGDVVEVEVLLDVTDNASNISLDQVGYRYVDAAGVVVTNDEKNGADVNVATPDTISFRITENRSNPDDASLDVSSSRSDVTLAIADVEIKKGEGTLEEVEVEITFTGATVSDDTISDLLSRITLEVDGDAVDYISSSSIKSTDVASKVLTLSFDADEFDMAEDDKFTIELLGNFKAYDESDITALQVTKITLSGYDEGKDKTFTPEVKTVSSFAPVYTLTQGDIDVVISGVEVKKTGDHAGSITFDMDVENDTGSALKLADAYATATKILTTPTSWEFEVKGYGVTATEIKLDTGTLYKNANEDAVENGGVAYLSDGDVATFEVTLTYTSTSDANFSIKVEKIGAKALDYTWKK
ncbi:MAG: hypothetical protein EOM85_04100, partial [Candidatus Moranbacteria bacterium]|nr:hypothetical protein [Candidatus Moranbacteria bacterium]